ncbi:MAG: hypothetical protein HPY58_05610 [Firmicutes bacterium]|nr:hypothetical protein [Bacillota bacterium]
MEVPIRQNRVGLKMQVRNKHVFASSLTSRGFFSYWDEILQDLKYVYLLKGSSPAGKSLFLRLLGLALADRGYQVEYFHKPEDHMTLEGVVVRSLGAAVLDGLPFGLNRGGSGLAPKVMEISLPERTSLQERDGEAARQARLQVAELLREAGEAWARVCAHYRKRLDEEAVKIRAANWAQEIFPKSSQLKHFFVDTIAPEGPVDFISFLSAACRKRYLIKGAPGTGSLVIQEILNHALSRHYRAEVYHSYLNPGDPVMLIFPEISTAVIDGTGGYHPSPLPGDTTWDLTGCLRPGGEGGGRSETPGTEAEQAEVELSFLLAAAAQAVRKAQQEQQEEEQIEAPPSGEAVAAFISRLLREASCSQTPGGFH